MTCFQPVGVDVHVTPGGVASGVAALPGSKSIINRYLACAALADGATVLRGATPSDDVVRMVAGLRALGIAVEIDVAGERISVAGGRGAIPAETARIDIGAAGTAMRFLTAIATLGFGDFTLDGTPRMRERPIGALVDGLRRLGAKIEYELADGFPPLIVHADGLTGGECLFTQPTSSQFISAILMAAPYARQDVFLGVDGVLVSRPYVDLTIDVMRTMGVEVVEGGENRFIVAATQRYSGVDLHVEPDASAATYFLAAAALTGGKMHIPALTRASRQGDAGFADVLALMGCSVAERDGGLELSAPADGRLNGVDVDLGAMPDTVQTLAVLAVFADGATRIRNVGNLRVKETDRLEALGRELPKLGARVVLTADSIEIHPPAKPTGGRIDTYDDHRMAMSFALAGLRASGVVIADAACVSKSFPDYFAALGSVIS